MNVLAKYVRGVEALVRGLGIAAMYLLLVILAVLMFPVIVQETDINTIWALEMAQFAVGAYYLLGAGWTLQRGAHVRMDFLYANWKPRTKAIVDTVTSFFVLFYLVIMLLGGWDSCAYAIVAKQINHTVWAPYMAPIKIAMVIGIFFMFLQMTAEFVKSLLAACKKDVVLPNPDTEDARLYGGRLVRGKYWKIMAICAAVGAFGAALLLVSIPHVTPEGGFPLLVVFIGTFLAVGAPIFTIPPTIRRFHDLDMSGWWMFVYSVLALIPGFGVMVMIGEAILLSQDGAPGTTGFGPDPKGRDLIKVFDPRIPKPVAPLAEAPLPAEPSEPHSYWLPYFVFLGVGVLLVAAGFGLAVLTSNPTWFLFGAGVFLVSLLVLIRGVVCMNH